MATLGAAEAQAGMLSGTVGYDPSRGTRTARPNLVHARAVQTATLLSDGMVLVAGGEGLGDRALASAELYHPGSGSLDGPHQGTQSKPLEKHYV